MNLSRKTFDPHRVVGILIAIGGVLAGVVLFVLSYEFLNREFGGVYSIYEMKEIAGLCFGVSVCLVVLAYFVGIENCIEK